MRAFRFVHAADLHLDTPFKGLAVEDEQVAEAVRDASLDVFDALVDLTINRGSLFLLLAGDLYDGESRGVRAQLRFLRGLERLSAANIKTFIVHGNHDPLGGWSAIRRWPNGVTIFGDCEVECFPVEVDGQTAANIYGISYSQTDVSENLALKFRRQGTTGLHVGLLHCNVGDNPDHGRYSPCSAEDLEKSGMDYWALGHIHRRPVECPRDPWVVYPGNLQGRSPKPSECGPKGALVVEADSSSVRSVEFVELDRARFVPTKLDVAGLGDLAELRQALEERAELLRQENGQRVLLVRVILVGRGEVHSDLTSGRLEELLADLRQDYADRRPMLYWESIGDRTAPEMNLAAIRDRGDFLADVLNYAEELRTQGAQMEEFLRQHLEDLGVIPSRVRGELELLQDRDVLEHACGLALDMLQQEAGE